MTSRVLIVVVAAGCGGALVAAQRIRPDPVRIAAMHENLQLVSTIQSAVVAADLTRVATPARILAQLAVPAGLPDSATRHVVALSEAAKDAGAATAVAAAATATARMLSRCGGCHREVGTMPAIASEAMPAVGGTVGHMLDHQRAIDRLLRGLVIPSNSEWLAGARALRTAPLHAARQPRDVKLAPELLRIEEAVHRLAEDAIAAESSDSRVRVYSTLLARCADCHGLHQRVWGPP